MRRNRNTADPATRIIARTTKQTRSTTAAAVIHCLASWSLSVISWRNSASLRSLVASRSWMAASRRSTEPPPRTADVAAAAGDDDVSGSSLLTSFDTMTSLEPGRVVLGPSSVSITCLLPPPPFAISFALLTDVSRSYKSTSLLSCLHSEHTQPYIQALYPSVQFLNRPF